MGEVKPTNFRIDSETADKFRAFCEENGMNQARGFDHIMQVLELDKAKEMIPGRETEIEGFERQIKGLQGAYLRSLELAYSTEERVYDQFKRQLESKDEQIITLQNMVKAKEDLATAANTAAMDAENKQRNAEKEARDAVAKAEAAQKMAKDKEAIVSMLTASLEAAEGKVKDYPQLKASVQSLKEELTKAQLDQQKAVAAVQSDMDKALLQAEKEKSAMERELREKISGLQDDRAALKEKIAENERTILTMEQRIKDLEKQISNLEAQE